MQLCCRYIDNKFAAKQPRAAIIFRGKGIRITREEQAQWDGRVDVYFQPKAWLNDSVLDEWTIRTFAPCTSYEVDGPEDFEESVLFCDNLRTQTRPAFKQLLWHVAQTKLHLFPTGVTDELQTIDDGLGVMVKRHMGDNYTNWLEANLERMLKGQVTASERRVVLTKFLAEAWVYVCENYDFLKSGHKNGCCMDVTGENHSEIRLQGLESAYSFSTADMDGTPASSDDEDEQAESDEDEQADDGLEIRSDSDRGVVSDESDDEHPGPSNVDDDGNFIPPEGTLPLDLPPTPMTLQILKARGIRLALRWPFGDEIGWELGNFTKYDTKGAHRDKYTVQFDDGQEVWFPVPPLAEYGCTVDKRWCLFQRDGDAEQVSSDDEPQSQKRRKRAHGRTKSKRQAK